MNHMVIKTGHDSPFEIAPHSPFQLRQRFEILDLPNPAMVQIDLGRLGIDRDYVLHLNDLMLGHLARTWWAFFVDRGRIGTRLLIVLLYPWK